LLAVPAFPLLQWLVEWNSGDCNHKKLQPAYSYGDSTGFTPDFPINPESSGTVSVQQK
jgi:hypothetical protein